MAVARKQIYIDKKVCACACFKIKKKSSHPFYEEIEDMAERPDAFELSESGSELRVCGRDRVKE